MKKDSLLFILKPSRYLSAYLVFAHGIALASIWRVSPTACFVATPFLSGCFLYYHHQKQPIIGLAYLQKREWLLHYADNHFEKAVLLPSSIMMFCFLILRFKTIESHEKKSLFLFSDAFLKKDYQAIRRCVRIGFL